MQNTEFFQRKRKECTVVLRESWTYGESLMNYQNQHKFDLETQINTVGEILQLSHLIQIIPLHANLNNNATIFGAVERILQTVCSHMILCIC